MLENAIEILHFFLWLWQDWKIIDVGSLNLMTLN